MLILLAIPVIAAVSFVHRLSQTVAPSNLLVKSVRSARPGWRVGIALLGLAALLFLTMHVVANAISAGAPGWLNLVVLILAWDALKVAWIAVGVLLRGIARPPRRVHRPCHVAPAADFVRNGPGPSVPSDLGNGRSGSPSHRRPGVTDCASPVDE
jgi:hypothetical protein